MGVWGFVFDWGGEGALENSLDKGRGKSGVFESSTEEKMSERNQVEQEFNRNLRKMQNNALFAIANSVFVTVLGLYGTWQMLLTNKDSWLPYAVATAYVLGPAYIWTHSLAIFGQTRSYGLIREIIYTVALPPEPGDEDFDSGAVGLAKSSLELCRTELDRVTLLWIANPKTFGVVFRANRAAKKALDVAAAFGFTNSLSDANKMARRFFAQTMALRLGAIIIAAMLLIGIPVMIKDANPQRLGLNLALICATTYLLSIAIGGLVRSEARLMSWEANRLSTDLRRLAGKRTERRNRQRLIAAAEEWEEVVKLYGRTLAIKWWGPSAIRTLETLRRATSAAEPHLIRITQLLEHVEPSAED